MAKKPPIHTGKEGQNTANTMAKNILQNSKKINTTKTQPQSAPIHLLNRLKRAMDRSTVSSTSTHASPLAGFNRHHKTFILVHHKCSTAGKPFLEKAEQTHHKPLSTNNMEEPTTTTPNPNTETQKYQHNNTKPGKQCRI